MSKPRIRKRPADRLPEPYRSRLLSTLSIIEVEGHFIPPEIEEKEVKRIEEDLANGGRERRRQEVERNDEARRNSKFKIPLFKVRNPLPRW